MSQGEIQVLMNQDQMNQVIDRLAGEVIRSYNGRGVPVLIGIRTGGAHLAHRLGAILKGKLGVDPPCGVIDINLYRDDWTRIAHRPRVGKTDIPFCIDDQDVLLVDDVLYTGRTVRAAMDALMDLGRPRRIDLLVLVDRGHRELPIAANFVGLTTPTRRHDLINVRLSEQEGQDEVNLVKSGS